MWSNTDGNKILDMFKKIQKIDLSKDSKEILKISLLTNQNLAQTKERNASEEKICS